MRGTLLITSSTGAGPWNITGNFADNAGLFGPADPAVGGYLFTYDAPNVRANRYRITAKSGAANPINMTVVWDEPGISPVAPALNVAVVSDVAGALPREVSALQQGLDEVFAVAVRNSITALAAAPRDQVQDVDDAPVLTLIRDLIPYAFYPVRVNRIHLEVVNVPGANVELLRDNAVVVATLANGALSPEIALGVGQSLSWRLSAGTPNPNNARIILAAQLNLAA
jgi:hypothetical protein